MALIPDWRASYRLYSQQAFAAIAALSATWAGSDALKALLPAEIVAWITFGLAVVGGIARVIAQNPPPGAR